MIEWFARNHVAANLLMFAIVVGGVYSLKNEITLERFPSFEPDSISVNVTLRGSTPEDAELSIATRVEEALKDLEGIEELESRSSEGGTRITLEVEKGYDPREILDDVKNRVDSINTLPDTAERPRVSLNVWRQHVITATVAGDTTEREIRELAEQVRDEILRLPDITQVDLVGVRDYEVAISVDQDSLQAKSLSLGDVANAIRRSAVDLSAGNVKTEGGEVLIRTKGQAYTFEDFKSIPLKTSSDGTLVLLGDIANIRDGFEESNVVTRFDGKLAAAVSVFRVGDQSAIALADAVKAYVAEKQNDLPQGITLNYWDDDSDAVKKRIETLVKNAIQGGLLVLILLSLFLRPAVAFWVFIGIPVCFLGAFLVMPFANISLNLVSLFAFIVVLGIVVDDAIVTGENVYTHLQRSDSGIDAAIRGTKEVAVPVTFGVLTTIAAFVPLAFMEGRRGPIFAQIPLIVVPVLLFSLVESKLILPAHLKFLKVKAKDSSNVLIRMQQRFANGFEQAIIKFYKPLLATALRNRGTTVVMFIAALACFVAALMVGHINYTFFPRIPSETVRMNINMPPGTPYEITDSHIQEITRHALDLQSKYIDEATGESIVTHVLSSTGGRGGAGNVGSVRFEITPPESRKSDIGSRELVREWRQKIGEIPGAEALNFRAEIGRSSDPIEIFLQSNDFKALASITEKVRAHLRTYPTVFDIQDSLADGKEELRIELLPEAHLQGITRAELLSQVRSAFFGIEAQRIQRGRDDVRVMVRFPIEQRNSLVHLNNMLIRSPTGQQIPLMQLAKISTGRSASTILRIDGYRTVSINADYEKSSTNSVALRTSLVAFLNDLSQQYPSVKYTLAGESEEEEKSLSSLKIGTFAVLFVIYTLLAIPFKSYFQPLIVMSVIPFAAIGAILGHLIMGMNVTIMSLMGLLALMGVVVNDSLVLVDYINKSKDRMESVSQAIANAGVARFRPVILTSLTTFIGLMPLLFEKSTQAQFLIPMAISLGFGIIFATLITLILVPVNYALMDDAKVALQKVFNSEPSNEGAS